VAYRVRISVVHRSEIVFHGNTYGEIIKHTQFKVSLKMYIHVNKFLNVYVMVLFIIHYIRIFCG